MSISVSEALANSRRVSYRCQNLMLEKLQNKKLRWVISVEPMLPLNCREVGNIFHSLIITGCVIFSEGKDLDQIAKNCTANITFTKTKSHSSLSYLFIKTVERINYPHLQAICIFSISTRILHHRRAWFVFTFCNNIWWTFFAIPFRLVERSYHPICYKKIMRPSIEKHDLGQWN